MRITSMWLAFRLLTTSNRRGLLSTTGWISLLGLVLGVASLVVSMAVISGFNVTLQKSVADVMGHIHILKLGLESLPSEELIAKVRQLEPSLVAGTPFLMVEGVGAFQGHLAGVMVQGLDAEKASVTLGLPHRIQVGAFDLSEKEGIPSAVIGKELAKSLRLKVGDELKIVVPIATEMDVSQFRRHLGRFIISGIVDLGKYEYDERMVFVSLPSAQQLAEVGDRYSGVLLRFQKIEESPAMSLKLSRNLGPEFRVKDWRDVNSNLFEAARIEKVVIFFVIFVIVVAASFNVASSLYINVIQRYPQIAILKAIGMSERHLMKIFSAQGVLMGFAGCVLGILLGLISCLGFTWAEQKFGLIAGEVYRIDHIDVQLQATDLVAIIAATVMICWVATLAPARRGSRLTTVEGLRNE